MDVLVKDCFQAAAWAVAVIGGLIAAFKALAEHRRFNDQRCEDMRWKRAEMAKKCVDEIRADPLARSALKMLDWSGASYRRPDGGETCAITQEVRNNMLRTANTRFQPGDDGQYVRDAYDALFDAFARLEHFIAIKLILFEDIDQAFRYYVGKLGDAGNRSIFDDFLKTYGFGDAQAFLGRFSEWQKIR